MVDARQQSSKMNRRDDWQPRLVSLANEWRNRPYVYGVTDCATFARAAVHAVTGVTLLPDLDRPKGWLAAAKTMIARGWLDVDQMATELLGEPFDPAQSRGGDIVSFDEGEELHLAVRIGAEAMTPSATGLRLIEPNRWIRAWKVG